MQTENRFNNICRVFNKNLYIPNTETILIETNVIGYQNFGLSVTNYFGDSVLIVNIYASADGINYYTVETGALNNVNLGLTQQYTFNSVNKFMRITATSTGTSVVDCYLIGEV